MTVDWFNQSKSVRPFANSAEVQTEWQARDTAESVKSWWHMRGFTNVMVWPEIIARNRDGRCMYGVKSNLRQGIPPGASPRDVARLYQREARR